MRKRLTTMTGVTAALTALALGGSAVATAAQGTASAAKKPAVEKTTGPDRDAIRSGDQTTPDTPRTIHKSTLVAASEAGASESAAESSPENSESSAPSDGPGGHADPAGVDSQTQE
jgi:hypothetical protein